MKQVLYHLEGHKPKPMFVVKEHDDGKVDLAFEEKGDPVVTKCEVTETPRSGSACEDSKTLVAQELEEAAKAEQEAKAKPEADVKAKPDQEAKAKGGNPKKG